MIVEGEVPLACGGDGVARDRIELSTFRFSVGRSYQLSYLAVERSPSIPAGHGPADP